MCDCAPTNDVTESISFKLHFLNRKLINKGIFLLFLSQEHFRGQVETGAGINFILLIFACVVLRKVHVHSLFTLETVFAIFRLR